MVVVAAWAGSATPATRLIAPRARTMTARTERFHPDLRALIMPPPFLDAHRRQPARVSADGAANHGDPNTMLIEPEQMCSITFKAAFMHTPAGASVKTPVPPKATTCSTQCYRAWVTGRRPGWRQSGSVTDLTIPLLRPGFAEPGGEVGQLAIAAVGHAHPQRARVARVERRARHEQQVLLEGQVPGDVIGGPPGERMPHPAKEPTAGQQLEAARPARHRRRERLPLPDNVPGPAGPPLLPPGQPRPGRLLADPGRADRHAVEQLADLPVQLGCGGQRAHPVAGNGQVLGEGVQA